MCVHVCTSMHIKCYGFGRNLFSVFSMELDAMWTSNVEAFTSVELFTDSL